MSMRNASSKRTICEVLREINDLCQSNNIKDQLIRKRLVEAEAMAKKMSYKLLEYNKNIFKDWWDKNEAYEKLLKKRLAISYLAGGQS